MSITNIPATAIRHCDCCGMECTPKNFVHEGKLVLTRAALDFQRQPVADATIRIDLCDRCNYRIGDAINAEQKAIKETP